MSSSLLPNFGHPSGSFLLEGVVDCLLFFSCLLCWGVRLSCWIFSRSSFRVLKLSFWHGRRLTLKWENSPASSSSLSSEDMQSAVGTFITFSLLNTPNMSFPTLPRVLFSLAALSRLLLWRLLLWVCSFSFPDSFHLSVSLRNIVGLAGPSISLSGQEDFSIPPSLAMTALTSLSVILLLTKIFNGTVVID